MIIHSIVKTYKHLSKLADICVGLFLEHAFYSVDMYVPLSVKHPTYAILAHYCTVLIHED